MDDLKKLLLGTRIFDQQPTEDNDQDEESEDSSPVD